MLRIPLKLLFAIAHCLEKGGGRQAGGLEVLVAAAGHTTRDRALSRFIAGTAVAQAAATRLLVQLMA